MNKISVCIATYNGSKYIKEQLSSILNQLTFNDEVIISDDKSTDNTIAIISAFNDRRIKIFTNTKFGSPIFNFENAISKAKGNYIFLSDQDDKWLPNKVKTMINALEVYDLVISNASIADENLNIVKDSYFEWRKSRTGFYKNLLINSYLGCCMAFRRKLLIDILPFPKNIPMHDMWIGMVAELYYKPVFINDKLMIYRRHKNNATVLSDNYTSKETFQSKFMFRLNLCVALINRSFKILLKRL